ncbi:MAG: SPOR domain-containing protein [Bacteroidales bacterium]|nr:SPOR domain-containing protein [Candidatus Colimorpha merdihippi]MCQ2282561.1 SPOR domain-containing protein [Bacteroidales bacterium]
MMNKSLLLLLCIVALMCPCKAQYTSGGNRSRGHVDIKGDVAVSQLVQKHIELNERVRTIPGYRIQVASLSGTASKNRAFEMKERIHTTYPGVEAYVVFDEPNFKVKVGDFRTRLEAYVFLLHIKADFPGTIIRDNIYPTQINWDDIVPETDEDI